MISITNFIHLTLNEKKMILTWRNNPTIQKVMHNKQKITLDEHINFIETLKISDSKKYFLVKEGDTYIGVIDFINISNNHAELGIYTNPNLKGYGKKLLNVLCSYAFDTMLLTKLYAEVYINNYKAIKLYQHFNFKAITTDTNKGIYYMELANENWSI